MNTFDMASESRVKFFYFFWGGGGTRLNMVGKDRVVTRN